MRKGIPHIEIPCLALRLCDCVDPCLCGSVSDRVNVNIHIVGGRRLDEPYHLFVIIKPSYALVPGLIHIIIQHPRGVPLHDSICKDLGSNHPDMLSVKFLCLLSDPFHILFGSIRIVIHEAAAEGIQLQPAFIVKLLVGTGIMLGQKLVAGVIYTRIPV